MQEGINVFNEQIRTGKPHCLGISRSQQMKQSQNLFEKKLRRKKTITLSTILRNEIFEKSGKTQEKTNKKRTECETKGKKSLWRRKTFTLSSYCDITQTSNKRKPKQEMKVQNENKIVFTEYATCGRQRNFISNSLSFNTFVAGPSTENAQIELQNGADVLEGSAAEARKLCL